MFFEFIIMNYTIQKSLSEAVTYEVYLQTLSHYLDTANTPAHPEEEMLFHYTQLNVKRMQRLNKTLSLLPEVETVLKEALKRPLIALVLSEGWCGDAAQVLPVLHLMASASTAVEFKVVFRDQQEDLMDLFLTNGAKSIPKVILIDAATEEVLAHWGPRPQGAIATVARLKEQYGGITEEVKIGLQQWYNEDKGHEIQRELGALFQNA